MTDPLLIKNLLAIAILLALASAWRWSRRHPHHKSKRFMQNDLFERSDGE